MAHPQAFSLRVNANPLAGGDADSLAKPVLWRLLEEPGFVLSPYSVTIYSEN